MLMLRDMLLRLRRCRHDSAAKIRTEFIGVACLLLRRIYDALMLLLATMPCCRARLPYGWRAASRDAAMPS